MLLRSGAGANPTATLTVDGGNWTVAAGTGLTSLSSTALSSGAGVTLTLTGASTGAFTLSLNAGSGVGVYTATLKNAAGSTLATYAITVTAPYSISSCAWKSENAHELKSAE